MQPEPPVAAFGGDDVAVGVLLPEGVEVDGGDSEPDDGGDDGVAGEVPPEGGEPPGVELPESTLIATFMPVWQWPIVGQMKYIGPDFDSFTVVAPPV